MRTPNTNTIYRTAVATPAASGQPVVTMRDFVSFLANPGDLAHGVNRKSPEYLQRREDEFMFFCGHLRGQFGKQLSEEDLKRVTKSARVGWEGSTPLHIAANYRHPDVLRHMLWDNPAAQSALNQTDRLGRTVLDWAMERPQGKNRTEILKILQGYQALRGTSGSAAKTTHRSITPRDIRLSTTGHSDKPTSVSSPMASRANPPAVVPRLDLTLVHDHAIKETAQTHACLQQVQRALKEQAAIEGKFSLLQRAIEKKLPRLPAQIGLGLKQKAADYRKRFPVPVATSQEHQTLQQLESMLEALRAHNDARRNEMEALRQEFVEAQMTTSSVATSATASGAIQPKREEPLGGSINRLGAEYVVIASSDEKPRDSANPDISTEDPIVEPSDTAAGQKVRLVTEYQSALGIRAKWRENYRTMKAQIETEATLGEVERNSLLTSIQRRTTALQDDAHYPAADELSTEKLEKLLATLGGDNALLQEGFEKLHAQRERLTTTPHDMQLSPHRQPSEHQDEVARQSTFLRIEVDDLRLLSARIASDSRIPEDARKKITEETGRALSNPLLQIDSQRISRYGNPSQKKWAALARAGVQANLRKISNRIYEQYEHARSGGEIELDWGKTRHQELLSLVQNQTREHIAQLRTELQPRAVTEEIANRLRNDMEEIYSLAAETLQQTVNTAPRDLPRIKQALSRLANALNQRLAHHLPWGEIQKAINAIINWPTLHNPAAQDDREELSRLKRQLAYQTQLNSISSLLAEPQNGRVILEYRKLVNDCANNMKEIMKSLERFSAANSALSNLGARSPGEARAAKLQCIASDLQVTHLDKIISRQLDHVADVSLTGALEPALKELRDACQNASAQLKQEAGDIETLHRELCASISVPPSEEVK